MSRSALPVPMRSAIPCECRRRDAAEPDPPGPPAVIHGGSAAELSSISTRKKSDSSPNPKIYFSSRNDMRSRGEGDFSHTGDGAEDGGVSTARRSGTGGVRRCRGRVTEVALLTSGPLSLLSCVCVGKEGKMRGEKETRQSGGELRVFPVSSAAKWLGAQDKRRRAASDREAVVKGGYREKQAFDLEAEHDRLKATLGDVERYCQASEQAAERARGEVEDLKSTRRRLDDKLLKLTWDVEALPAELESAGAKAIVDYNMS
ncbi:hypothetical protein GW17_00038089 [Ensete ventricosum]|nr:hypothetical protein GW17_00038089 [Ensete ventricosum]